MITLKRITKKINEIMKEYQIGVVENSKWKKLKSPTVRAFTKYQVGINY